MVSESTTNISHILITAVPKQKYAETLLQKTRTPITCYTNMILKTALILFVGKSGFVSHTKHTAKATNTDLFHS